MREIARQSEKFLHGYFNEEFYDFERNGEAGLIAAIVRERSSGPLFVLDVGAHKGDWAKAVLTRKPDAVIYCFEIVPALARMVRNCLAGYPTAYVCDYGLSSASHEVEVFWNKTWDTMSAIAPRHEDQAFVGTDVTRIAAHVKTGDEVVTHLRNPKVDLIKIDVEGHEIEVLSGFQKTLKSPELRPRIIQFEYGQTWLPSRHALQEAYMLLEPAGYVIGRLHPDGVDFKAYAFKDDHFRMGNHVAMLADDPLRAKIAHFEHRNPR